MNYLYQVLLAAFRPANPAPAQARANFIHLYLEMVGMGILSGSTLAFVAIYASRLGASGTQIGLISAFPGIISLLFTFPVGEWLANRPIGRAVFWSSLFQRAFYLLLIPLPVLFDPAIRIWAVIAILFLMNIPGTAVVVGMNALLGAAVPPDWRAHVMGVRNACLAAAQTLTALVCSQILAHSSFTTGYQLVFGLGFLGAVLSSLQLWLIQPMLPLNAHPVSPTNSSSTPPHQPPLRRLTQLLRLEVIRGPFGKVVFLLFIFHITQLLPQPIFPIYQVHVLVLSDQMIGIGSMLFNLGVFLGSTQLARVTRRWGNQRTTAIGIMLHTIFPALLTLGHIPAIYLLNIFTAGIFYAILFGALYNYLLEHSQAADLPAHMAWYNLVLNAATLIGSLSGPAIGNWIGLTQALLLFSLFRLFASLAIYFKG